MNEKLNEVKTVALAKVIKAAAEKEAAAMLKAGEYKVDFTVRVSGSMKKGEDYDSDIVAKCDPWLLLAAALSKLNTATVESLTAEAVSMDPALVEGLKVKAQVAIEAIKATTTTRCNGKITTKLAVEVVA
jgi:hypothetical protein